MCRTWRTDYSIHSWYWEKSKCIDICPQKSKCIDICPFLPTPDQEIASLLDESTATYWRSRKLSRIPYVRFLRCQLGGKFYIRLGGSSTYGWYDDVDRLWIWRHIELQGERLRRVYRPNIAGTYRYKDMGDLILLTVLDSCSDRMFQMSLPTSSLLGQLYILEQ